MTMNKFVFFNIPQRKLYVCLGIMTTQEDYGVFMHRDLFKSKAAAAKRKKK